MVGFLNLNSSFIILIYWILFLSKDKPEIFSEKFRLCVPKNSIPFGCFIRSRPISSKSTTKQKQRPNNNNIIFV